MYLSKTTVNAGSGNTATLPAPKADGEELSDVDLRAWANKIMV